jgi:hypothetical protein
MTPPQTKKAPALKHRGLSGEGLSSPRSQSDINRPTDRQFAIRTIDSLGEI